MNTIDRYCSGAAWGIASREAFFPKSDALVYRCNEGFLAMLSERSDHWGVMLLPLDASWFLGCPLVGPLPDAVLARFLDQTPGPNWDTLLISGLQQGSPLFSRLLQVVQLRHEAYKGPPAIRRIADLREGADAYLARRPRSFRANLRRLKRRAQEAGLSIQILGADYSGEGVESLFLRMMDVERRGWKGQAGVGVNAGSMRRFYHRLIRMQAPLGQTRAILVTHEGQDVGYMLGGVAFNTFRGYQFSFDDEYRALGPGNLMQWVMIEALCEEGVAFYDLGTDMEYKRRWADFAMETVSLLVPRK